MHAHDAIRQVLDAWFPPGLEQADTATHHQVFEAWFGGQAPALPAGLAAAAARLGKAGGTEMICESEMPASLCKAPALATGAFAAALLDVARRVSFAGAAGTVSASSAPLRFQSTGGTTCTMLWHLGQDRIWPMADSSLTLSRAEQVVH